MRMIATVRIVSDDGMVAEESTNVVGVDTRVRGLDPDAAKEDFIAQARGLLTSIGETHVPAMFATVQGRIDAGEPEEQEALPESQAMVRVKGRLQQLRKRKAADSEQGETQDTPEQQNDEPEGQE